MTSSVDKCHQVLDWAETKLNELGPLVEDCQKNSHTVVESLERHPDGFYGKVWRVKDVKPPDSELSRLVVECAGHVRSALDHLICLIVASAGETENSMHQFPICHDKGAFRKFLDNKRAVIGLGAVLSELATLQRFAPGSRFPPDAHPLWQLSSIVRVGKHRRIVAVQVIAGSSYLGIGGTGRIPMVATFPALAEEDAIIGFVELPEPPLDSQIEIIFNAGSSVQFCDVGMGVDGALILDTLAGILAYARQDVMGNAVLMRALS